MNESISNINQVRYWVYLTPNDSGTGYHIAFDIDLLHKIETEKIDLRYYRKFDNLLDGLAHKLLLETISGQSLQRIIWNNNPDNKNLATEILKETYIK